MKRKDTLSIYWSIFYKKKKKNLISKLWCKHHINSKIESFWLFCQWLNKCLLKIDHRKIIDVKLWRIESFIVNFGMLSFRTIIWRKSHYIFFCRMIIFRSREMKLTYSSSRHYLYHEWMKISIWYSCVKMSTHENRSLMNSNRRSLRIPFKTHNHVIRDESTLFPFSPFRIDPNLIFYECKM